MPNLTWNLIVRNGSEPGIKDFEQTLGQASTKAKTAAKAIGAGLGAAGAVGAGLLAKGFADNMDIQDGQAKLKAQLGLSTADSAKAGKASAQVYGENFGDSIDQVNDAIKAVGNNISDLSKLSQSQIKDMTESALTLSQAFDIDVNDSTRAAGALMKNGLAKDSKEAFDIITAGEQNGLDKAGDFLDSITEYSPQFKKLGIGGKQALDILQSGLKAGAKDTDAIADAFKEFSLRSIDGSKTTAQGFKDIGLDAKDMAKQIAAGGPAAENATEQTITALNQIKDPVKQNTAGVALFGTQWEDTVRQILPALDDTRGAITNVDGSTQRMSDTLGSTASSKIETVKRHFEQWTQSMAKSDSALGTVVTGLGAFGPGLVTTATQLGTLAIAFKGTAAAELVTANATKVLEIGMKGLRVAFILMTGPVGLVIAAIALLAAGLIYAYKHSETFRNIVNSVFKSVANTVLSQISFIIGGFEKFFAALGHLPGIAGKAFRTAASSASSAKHQVDNLRESINAVKSKTVHITTVLTQKQLYGSAGGHYVGSTFVPDKRAAGGPVSAGKPYIVGERGPELIIPRNNGTVLTAAQTVRLSQRNVGSKTGDGDGHVINVYVQGSLLANAKDVRDAVTQAFKVAPAGSRRPVFG